MNERCELCHINSSGPVFLRHSVVGLADRASSK